MEDQMPMAENEPPITAPIMTPVNTPAETKKDHWRTVGIILIILAVIFAAAAGYLLWAKNDQKSQVDDLNNKVEQANTKIEQLKKINEDATKETANNGNSGNSEVTTTVTVAESYNDIVSKLQAVTPSGVTLAGPTLTMRYQSNGYQSAQISASDSVEMFYKTSASANWKYFMGTQNDLLCSAFNTSDLKKAFAGMTCFNPNNSQNVL